MSNKVSSTSHSNNVSKTSQSNKVSSTSQSNVSSTSHSDNVSSTFHKIAPKVKVNLPIEEIKGWSRNGVELFLRGKKNELNLQGSDIDKMYNNEINGKIFLTLTRNDLQSIGLPLGPAKSVENLIKEINIGIICLT